jgi:hypothetical protein
MHAPELWSSLLAMFFDAGLAKFGASMKKTNRLSVGIVRR